MAPAGPRLLGLCERRRVRPAGCGRAARLGHAAGQGADGQLPGQGRRGVGRLPHGLDRRVLEGRRHAGPLRLPVQVVGRRLLPRAGQAALYKPGGGALCSYKAHFTCPNWDSQYHDLCGYWLAAAPDNYVNEEWFGITTPSPCWLWGKYGGQRLDTLYVRPAFLGMQLLWSGLQEVDTVSHHVRRAVAVLAVHAGPLGRRSWPTEPARRCVRCRQLAVGPGSAGAHQRWLDSKKRVLGSRLLGALRLGAGGGQHRAGWLAIAGRSVPAAAGGLRASREDAEMTTPLLVRQQREMERQRGPGASRGAAPSGGA